MAEHTDADVDLVARALADSAYGSPDDHVPWHYTEFGVICACGASMRDEECLANWDHMPEDHKDNWRPDARAALSALSAAGRDHAAGVAEGRRRERESVVAYLREFVGHLSARDIEQGRHLEGRPPLPTVAEIDEAARRLYLERIEGHTDEP